jgi:hypothetical protein
MSQSVTVELQLPAVGITPTGRATVLAVGMNRRPILLIRRTPARLGMFP